MSDLQAIADRVEIEALRGECADAVMMHDYDRARWRARHLTRQGAAANPAAVKAAPIYVERIYIDLGY
jgi:hypothetical protein